MGYERIRNLKRNVSQARLIADVIERQRVGMIDKIRGVLCLARGLAEQNDSGRIIAFVESGERVFVTQDWVVPFRAWKCSWARRLRRAFFFARLTRRFFRTSYFVVMIPYNTCFGSE